MFEGFKVSMMSTGEAVIRVRHGGNGPPRAPDEIFAEVRAFFDC